MSKNGPKFEKRSRHLRIRESCEKRRQVVYRSGKLGSTTIHVGLCKLKYERAQLLIVKSK